jgi:hypothetical protein
MVGLLRRAQCTSVTCLGEWASTYSRSSSENPYGPPPAARTARISLSVAPSGCSQNGAHRNARPVREHKSRWHSSVERLSNPRGHYGGSSSWSGPHARPRHSLECSRHGSARAPDGHRRLCPSHQTGPFLRTSTSASRIAAQCNSACSPGPRPGEERTDRLRWCVQRRGLAHGDVAESRSAKTLRRF